MLLADGARRAATAGGDEAHHHVVADGEAAHAGAHLDHLAGALVAADDRELLQPEGRGHLRVEDHVPGDHVLVAVAQARGRQLDEDLTLLAVRRARCPRRSTWSAPPTGSLPCSSSVPLSDVELLGPHATSAGPPTRNARGRRGSPSATDLLVQTVRVGFHQASDKATPRARRGTGAQRLRDSGRVGGGGRPGGLRVLRIVVVVLDDHGRPGASGQRLRRRDHRLQRPARADRRQAHRRLHRRHRDQGEGPLGRRGDPRQPDPPGGLEQPRRRLLRREPPGPQRPRRRPPARRRRASHPRRRSPRPTGPTRATGSAPRPGPWPSPTTPARPGTAALPASILDLTKPEWKGKVGFAPTETDFQPIVTTIVKQKGAAFASSWLAALKANGKVYGDNEALIAAVDRGEIQTGIVDHYYWYRLRDEVGAGKVKAAPALLRGRRPRRPGRRLGRRPPRLGQAPQEHRGVPRLPGRPRRADDHRHQRELRVPDRRGRADDQGRPAPGRPSAPRR